jgi:hypothetical protein
MLILSSLFDDELALLELPGELLTAALPLLTAATIVLLSMYVRVCAVRGVEQMRALLNEQFNFQKKSKQLVQGDKYLLVCPRS